MRVVIFGTNRLASLTWSMLRAESSHEVAGFTVDASFLRERELHGLPVVPFEQLEDRFAPAETAIAVALGWHSTTGIRESRRRAAVSRGYRSVSFVSPRAITYADLSIGEDSLVFAGTIIEPFGRIGSSVTIRAGCMLSHDVTVGDNCYIAPRACLAGRVTVGRGCFIGVGATISPYVTVAEGCFIAAGAHVQSDTKPGGVYEGVPARRRSIPASRMGRLLGTA
jgi:sugar O-acyltransferase (sialic acid O-acetyltransferase NeuD family)